MPFWGVKGLARRRRGGRAAHQQQGLRLILGVGRYTPTGGNFTTAKVAFPLNPHAYKKKCWCNLTTKYFFTARNIYLKGPAVPTKRFAEI